MNPTGKIHIGTSGWHYKHWKDNFYPPSLDNKDFLKYYANYFQTAEINNAFYKLPEKETFAQWRDSVPEDFVFSVKASRYITHMKKLTDPQKAISSFVNRIDILQSKLGPILFQLPPNWRINIERLKSFLEALPEGYRYAFEFRNSSWFDEAINELLKERGAAFCIYDMERRLSPKLITASFIYIRLHGPNRAYEGSYEDNTLSEWSETILSWAENGMEIFCYFDNDERGYAVQNAMRLKQLVADK